MAQRQKPRRLAAATLLPLAAIAWLLALLLTGCGGGGDAPPPAVQKTHVKLEWWFSSMTSSGQEQEWLRSTIPDANTPWTSWIDWLPKSGNLHPMLPTGRGPYARSEAMWDGTGKTYGATSDSTVAYQENNYIIETGTHYQQTAYYRKIARDASVSFTVSAIHIESVGGNPWNSEGCTLDNFTTCPGNLVGSVDLLVMAAAEDDTGVKTSLGWWNSSEELAGQTQMWAPRHIEMEQRIWSAGDVEFEYHNLGAVLRLTRPVKVTVPLDAVPVNGKFYLKSILNVVSYNGQQAESGISAMLRDPLGSGGTTFELTGVEPVPLPDPIPELPPPPLPPVCTGPVDPEAGTLGFSTAGFETTEGGRTRLRILRSGGTKGKLAVRVKTADAQAMAGSDYNAIDTMVEFPDGGDTERRVDLWVRADGQIESDETLTVGLSDLRGCAALGATAANTITILDTESRKMTYTLGGTVTGLVGSGLFVRSNGFDVRVDSNGPFTLPGRFAPGTVYGLDVEVQPNNPLQSCRVTNGTGTVGNANVTDLAVVCDPPAPSPGGGALDPGFAGGLVSNPSYGRILSMATQTDGRLVVLTDFNRLMRYQVDGTLDTSFGSGGVVNATLSGSALDLLRAVALQADGGILVTGVARSGGGSATADDMGVKRYLPNGTVDAAWGTAGFVRVDIAGRSDDAVAIAVQPDGKIVLGGLALVNVAGASDFALARLQADGTPDAGFGNGGRLTVDMGGAFDSAAAMALQADGAIVLVGRTATGGAATPDTGVARVSASGVVELALRLPLTAYWDEATGVAIQPDGKIVLTLEARPDAGDLYQHALARLKPDGTLDESFGTAGVALASFSVGGDHARAPVLLADGRIATAGFARNQVQQLSDKDDFLITRHLADGTLDAGFGSDGKLVIDFFGAADGASALLLQPDGKLLAGGLARSGSSNGLGLVRVLP